MSISNETWLLINSITGFIGAAAWLSPMVYDKLQPTKLALKLFSQNTNTGTFNGQSCIMHFFAFNIIAINNDFHIKDINIKIKYKDCNDIYTGELFYARINRWVDSQKNQFNLRILPEEMLPYVGTLQKSINKKVYLVFKTDKAILADWEELKINFTDYKNKKIVKNLFANDVDPKLLIWDDRIWESYSEPGVY